MQLTEEQIEKRTKTAEDLEEVFLYGLTLLFLMEQAQSVNYAMALASVQERYGDVLDRNEINNSSSFRDVHVPETVASVLSTTISDPEKTFNFSEDRAALIAENEANAVWNDAEFLEAIDEGYTEKTWRSIIDKRTRDTHRYLDGETKPILEPFEVGEYLMMYPKDESLGAGGEEIANCRCSVEYSGESDFKTEEKSDIIFNTEDVDKYVGQPIVETDNQHVREWYVANVSHIPYMIDKSGTIEMQAREAYSLRNKFKHEARVAMSDRFAAIILERNKVAKSFDELIASKMERKGLSREEAIADILATASTTNIDVNKEFGL